MFEPDPVQRRRLSPVSAACKYGGFKRTKCYQLIHEGRIKAYKLDRRTLIDLDSVDELHKTLPRIENKGGRLRP